MLNADQVKTYSMDAVQWAVGTGLISGRESVGESGNIITFKIKGDKTYGRVLSPFSYTSSASLVTAT